MLASLNHVDLRFGPQEVLKDVTWAIQEGECWGVIGRNGAGKSTVFKLLLGQLEADSGTVVRPTKERGIRMGHYAQDLVPETQGSVLEEALAAFGDVETPAARDAGAGAPHGRGWRGSRRGDGALPEGHRRPSSTWMASPSAPAPRASSQSLGFSAADFEKSRGDARPAARRAA